MADETKVDRCLIANVLSGIFGYTVLITLYCCKVGKIHDYDAGNHNEIYND